MPCGLTQAKRRAVAILDREHERIVCAFCMYLKSRVPKCNVVFDHKDAKRRIRAAVLMSRSDCLDRALRDDEIYGETDGDQIWINPACSRELMVLTLIHEALHDSVHVCRCTRRGERKYLSARDEHAVMRGLTCCI